MTVSYFKKFPIVGYYLSTNTFYFESKKIMHSFFFHLIYIFTIFINYLKNKSTIAENSNKFWEKWKLLVQKAPLDAV